MTVSTGLGIKNAGNIISVAICLYMTLAHTYHTIL